MDEQTQETLRRVQHDHNAAALVAEVVALATGVPANDIQARGRRQIDVVQARRIAMYLAYVIFQWPLERVGAAFGRDRTTAGAACRVVEDLRDDPEFDARVERLEACLRLAPIGADWSMDGLG